MIHIIWFEPQYINIRGKGDLIKSLKKDAKDTKKIYLATDPDREGEAIAWHLSNLLDVDREKITRVTFNEITKTAVQKAMKNSREIDLNLVDAQQARRVLDRIVGYKISPVLWKKVKRGLSAGRVQSVAVKLIVDKEEEIENFIPEEYWNIYVELQEGKEKKIFEAKLVNKNGEKINIHSKEESDKILEDLKNAKYIVKEVKKLEKKRNPAPPFTTSTMQQEASRKINFSLKKTMSVAQGLYEGIKLPNGHTGLITYMRTDSTRISEEARIAAKEQILKTYGDKYYEKPFEQELEKAEKELEHVQLVDEVSDVQCEKCGRMMVYKYGRYGKFLACPGFPECRNVKPIIETIDVPCPKCGATVQVRKTKRKRNYYICENNPTSCDYISWNKPKPGEKWNPEEAEEVKKETEKKTRTTKKSSTKQKKK